MGNGLTDYSDDPVSNDAIGAEGHTFPWFAIQRHIAVNGKIMGMELSRFRTWIWLMAKTNNGGMLPADLQELAQWPFLPNFSFDQLMDDIRYLLKRGLIDECDGGRLKMHDFEEHQPAGMMTASNRAAEKKRSKGAIRAERYRQNHPEKFGKKPKEASPRQDGVSSITVEGKRDDNASGNAESNAPSNAWAQEESNAPLTPYIEAEKIKKEIEKRQQQQQPAAAAADLSEEWRKCFHWLQSNYPQGKIGPAPNAMQAFHSLTGLEAPLPDGSNIQRSGIPTPEYFWNTVAPALERAKNSQQWAPRRGTGERVIPNLTTFLTGNRNMDNPNFGRNWMIDWEQSAESVVAAKAEARAPKYESEIPREHMRQIIGVRKMRRAS